MILGLIGIFVPGLPGNGLIFVAALGYGFFTDFSEINALLLFIFAGITILAILFDYIGSLLGAKKFGATKFGIAWGIVGGIIGFLTFGIIGLIVGQFIGTVGGEFAKGKKIESSMKSGLGALIGYILSVAANMSIGILMIALFLLRVL